MTDADKYAVQQLLSDADSIIDKHKALSSETGSDFNIFKIAGISEDERIICRVLHELLSPDGSHGQGGAYLEMFLRNCVGMEFRKDELNNADVRREHPANGRFLDITIRVGKRFIPIEVKIWAADQDRQCFDYYDFAKNNNGNAQVIYLTPYGHAPSPSSAEGLTKEGEGYKEIKQISFAVDILKWLKDCLSLPETIRKAPIREIMIQFISAIERFTGKLEDRKMTDMIDMIKKTSQNMKNAYAISESLSACEDSIRKSFFEALCDKIGENEQIVLDRKYDENEKEWPGVRYIVKPEIDTDVYLSIYIQVNGREPLNAGFQYVRHGIPENNDLETMQSLRTHFTGIEGIKKFESKSWAIFQDYITYQDKHIHLMNINSNDSNFFDLCDPVLLEKTVTEAALQIKAMFKMLNNYRES